MVWEFYFQYLSHFHTISHNISTDAFSPILGKVPFALSLPMAVVAVVFCLLGNIHSLRYELISYCSTLDVCLPNK